MSEEQERKERIEREEEEEKEGGCVWMNRSLMTARERSSRKETKVSKTSKEAFL